MNWNETATEVAAMTTTYGDTLDTLLVYISFWVLLHSVGNWSLKHKQHSWKQEKLDVTVKDGEREREMTVFIGFLWQKSHARTFRIAKYARRNDIIYFMWNSTQSQFIIFILPSQNIANTRILLIYLSFFHSFNSITHQCVCTHPNTQHTTHSIEIFVRMGLYHFCSVLCRGFNIYLSFLFVLRKLHDKTRDDTQKHAHKLLLKRITHKIIIAPRTQPKIADSIDLRVLPAFFLTLYLGARVLLFVVVALFYYETYSISFVCAPVVRSTDFGSNGTTTTTTTTKEEKKTPNIEMERMI